MVTSASVNSNVTSEERVFLKHILSQISEVVPDYTHCVVTYAGSLVGVVPLAHPLVERLRSKVEDYLGLKVENFSIPNGRTMRVKTEKGGFEFTLTDVKID